MNRLFPDDLNIYLRIFFSFLASSGRYLIFSGGAFLLYYIFKKSSWLHLKIQQRFPKQAQLLGELKYSFSTIIIFTAYGILMFFLKKNYGITGNLYTNVSDHGTAYFIFSILVLIVMHDTYFYWTHRLMHHPRVFRYVHKVHHYSTNPTPLAVYSFHPLEALVNGGFAYFALFTIPVHLGALITFLLLFIFTDILLHLGYEIFPKSWTKHPLLKYINASTHHNMHHQYFKGNYGLYFNVWDRLMNTQNPDYDRRFEEVTNRKEDQ